MKIRAIYILVVSFLLLSSYNSAKSNNISNTAKEYVINGKIKGIEDGIIYLKQYDVLTRTNKTLDSTTISNGEFVFKGTVSTPDQVSLQKGENYLTFFLENTKIEIIGDATIPHERYEGIKATIKGSKLNDLYKEQQAKEKAIMEQEKYAELSRLQESYNKAQQERDLEKSKKIYEELNKLDNLSEERSSELLNSKLKFIDKHPSSPLGPQVLGYMFTERYLTVKDMDKIMETFSGPAVNTSMYRYFNDEYQAIKRTSSGAKAPEFTLKTPEGREFSLSQTKGKYVLLDFWASWCKPCRASYPHLKKVYEKYKDKGFEVVAISDDSNHEAWKKAINEDQTTWIQVVDTFSRPGFPSDIGTLYAVPFLPTTYLLDKNGMILAKNLHADELDAELKKIFGF